MSSPKEIAEKIIRKLEVGDNFSRKETIDIALAYLELEKKISEAPIYDIYVLEAEISKLKEENDKLKLELNLGKSSLRCGQCGNIGMFHHGFAMADEIAKLKKSREGLRSVCEFYASSDQWNCTKEQLTTYNTIDKDDLGVGDFQFACDVDDDRVGGKKAREAINADDELMKEGEE